MAWPLTPYSVGEVADQSYSFTWTDTNYINTSTLGEITIDWFYTRVMPPTFHLGVSPPDLEGTPIVRGIPEADRTDGFTWNTATVAPGSYWIWSRMTDLPGETSLKINAFSRGVITVAHPGDVVHPAIAMTTPRSPFEVAEQDTYDVVYEAFDPDGSGVVTLEAMRSRDGSDAILIARDLPAARSATVAWPIGALEEGDWILRAHLRDGRGLESTAYARFVLTIEHPTRPDAGPIDAMPPVMARDGGSEDIGTYDAGQRVVVEEDGCGCSAVGASTRGDEGAVAIGLLLAATMLRRRGRAPRRA